MARNAALMAEAAGPATELCRGLGLLDSTTIIMGSMIGSGIFIVSADIARQVKSPGLLLSVWGVTAIMTVIAALTYGELAAAMPRAGGQYVYLREAYGPLLGFLYGWTLFLVIQTGTIAAVAVAFAKFLGVFIAGISEDVVPLRLPIPLTAQAVTFTSARLVAIAVIGFLTYLNTRGLDTGKLVQNIFTFAKTGALLGLIGIILVIGAARGAGSWAHLAPFWPAAGQFATPSLILAAFGAALVGSLFSADAWNNITFTAGEVDNPRRNLPFSLALGTGIVTTIYFLANMAYLYVLSLDAIQTATNDRVGTAAVRVVLGNAGILVIAGAILVSTFGCINGLILAGARVYYAMARDRLFFQRVGTLNQHRVPGVALVFQGVWAALLTLSGAYGDLLDYVMFAVMVFYVLTVVGLFILRQTQPDLPRPYKAIGYPLLPIIYLVFATWFSVNLFFVKPRNTWPGMVIVLLGVPVYLAWRAQNKSAAGA